MIQDSPDYLNTDKSVCRVIATLLADAGVRDVVVSPGSRNAPLLIAVDAETRLRKHIVVDERAAAFMAVGIAQTSQLPVALVCTSGSAVLNYAPALAEAFYRGLPIIAISADRPEEWIDQDDSQTIHQYEALEKIVKRSYDIPEYPCGSTGEDGSLLWFANRIVNDALTQCRLGKPGPVHINVQLRAPLGRLTSAPLPPQRLVNTVTSADNISPTELKRLIDRALGKRILVVAGFMEPDARLQQAFQRLQRARGGCIMAETISNLHLPSAVYSIDKVLSTLTASRKAELTPDIVITVGGALISRQVKEFLRTTRPEAHWAAGHQHTTVDCFTVLTERIEADPAQLLRKLAGALVRDTSAPDYAGQWEEERLKADISARAFIADAPWGELLAYDRLFSLLPAGINLIVSNGTSIRYNQLLATTPYHATFCNRGVSGIDGCTSTAIGSAIAFSGKTVLLTGDMSFAYDLSALAIRSIPPTFKIIVVNNSGGGIFRFVGSTRSLPIREKYFCAPHPIDICSLARAFGFSYFCADSQLSLENTFRKFMTSDDAPSILELCVPGENGGEILSGFMNRPTTN